MAQLQRVDGQVELKCHADMNFDLWANKINLFLIICPDKIKNMHVEGQWNKAGSVITTYYAISKYNFLNFDNYFYLPLNFYFINMKNTYYLVFFLLALF